MMVTWCKRDTDMMGLQIASIKSDRCEDTGKHPSELVSRVTREMETGMHCTVRYCAVYSCECEGCSDGGTVEMDLTIRRG